MREAHLISLGEHTHTQIAVCSAVGIRWKPRFNNMGVLIGNRVFTDGGRLFGWCDGHADVSSPGPFGKGLVSDRGVFGDWEVAVLS